MMILQKATAPDYLPQRIISLVPSQTELLYHLGLQNETQGITKFCIHPHHWLSSKTIIGGTKTVNIDKIKQLNPKLVIANKEENVKEQVEAIAANYPVWVTDVNSLGDALQMIADIGMLTGKAANAIEICKLITQNFSAIQPTPVPINTAYLIWQKPFMTVGSGTFINSMLSTCGLHNVFNNSSRYPITSIDELQSKNLQLLLLSSEPYPFKQKHIDDLHKKLPGVEIKLCNGEFFSWYGSRLIQAPAYFNELLASIKTV